VGESLLAVLVLSILLAAVARRFGPAGVLGAATIERAPRRMWVAMMTVLTAVVTTVAVTGATGNAVDSTVASFASIADADVWVSSAAATDYSSTLLPPTTAADVAAVPGAKRVVPDQMAFATVGDAPVERTEYVADCKCKAHPWEQQARDQHRVYALTAAKRKGDKTAAAEYLAVGPSYIDALIASGELPASRLPSTRTKGRAWSIRIASIASCSPVTRRTSIRRSAARG